MTTAMRMCRMLPALVFALLLAPAALAQSVSPAQLLEDFVHYASIGRPELAADFGRKLLDSGITDAEIAALVDEGELTQDRFDYAIRRGLQNAQLENIAAEIGRRTEEGRLDLARDSERIAEAIKMLTGTQRQQMLARERLQHAGEYAVPALLRVIVNARSNEREKIAGQQMLVAIGRQAVTPLGTAMSDLHGTNQIIIADILGSIGWPHAGPYLLELAHSEGADRPARDAARRAYRIVAGGESESRDVSAAYAGLASQYFDERDSLIANPDEPINNVWSYDTHTDLVATPVPTAIFSEVMAMQLASHALEIDQDNRAALGLYVASNLRRENQLPDGEADPIYGERTYSPSFYATVFGTAICLDVLDRALEDNDTQLIRDAIAALTQTTGGANLFAGDQTQPLLAALAYADRRVQYEAALTLARALPTQGFTGDHRVVPLLASAVRTGNQAFAAVVAGNEEDRRQIAGRLETLGYTIIGSAGSVANLAGIVRESVAVDLVVVQMSGSDESMQVVSALRGLPKATAAPVLVLAQAVDVPGLERDYRNNPRVAVSRPGISPEAFSAVIDALLSSAAGGRITDTEAEIYAFEALGALQDIAISGSPAYSIADAEPALLDALETRTGGVRLEVAHILSSIDSDRAQRALFDAALAGTDQEQIELLNHVADSVKRFGDRAEKRHVLSLIQLIENSSGATAEAAARVHGAMNIATSEAVRLIFK